MADELDAYDIGWREGCEGRERRVKFGDDNLTAHYQMGYDDGEESRGFQDNLKKLQTRFPPPPKTVQVNPDLL